MSTPVLYVSTVLIWGSSWYVVKLQLTSVAPEVSIFYRFAIAAALLQAFCILRKKPMAYGVSAHLLFAQLGFFLFFLNFLLIYHASYHLTTGLVSVIFSLVMVFNMLNGRMFLRDEITVNMILGALLGIIGVVMLFLPEVREFSLDNNTLLGIVLGLFGTMSASAGMVTSAQIQKRGLPVIRSNAWGMVYGALFMLIYILGNQIPFSMDWSPVYMFSLLFLAIFASVLGFGCFLTLVGRAGAAKAAYASVLFPLVALFISTLLENYIWSIIALLGVALALGGNVLIILDKQKST